MPDLETRQKHERHMAAILLLLFDDERERLLATGRFAPVRFTQRLEADLVDPLARAFTARGEQLLTAYNVARPIDATARRWAERYSGRLAKELVESTRNRIAELDPLAPDFEQSLADLFGEGRAEAIGITETTRAISAGEDGAVGLIKRTTGRVLIATWFTELDERVCPICEPLHGTTSRVWSRKFPSGPPAHPRCRCWREWQ